jgi:hypothetical protein
VILVGYFLGSAGLRTGPAQAIASEVVEKIGFSMSKTGWQAGCLSVVAYRAQALIGDL